MITRHRTRTGSLLLASVLAAAALVVVMRPSTAEASGVANLPSCPTAGQACVAVKVVNNGQQVGSLTFTPAGDLAGSRADVSGAAYAVPNSGSTSVDRGTSISRLITDAVGGTKVQFAEIDAPDGYGRHLLTGSELDPPSPGQQVPVLYPNPQGNATDFVNFVRPNRGGGDDQLQPGPELGFFQSDERAALEVVVHLSGDALRNVSATATPVAGSNDRSYTLSCQTCGAGDSTNWVFPDGTTSSQATPTYTFPTSSQAGSYPIAVAVDEPNGSFGWGMTSVRIGPAPTPSASPTAKPGSGGHGQGHHGGTYGNHGGSTNPGHGSGHGGSGTASPSAAPTSGPTSQPSGVPTLVPSLPTAEPSSSLYVPATGGPLSSPSSQVPRPTPTLTPTATPTPSEPPLTGTAVSGVLLTDAENGGGQPPPSAILDVPAPTASAAPALDPKFRIDPLVWLAVGGVVLLVAGAASESDRVRRRLRRWARIGA